ncbi:hypothetical protein [Tenacibaculum singaporense]|uniref:hypothetical protein n=1 Tax=Tenacibaculum singaporense TaxID=2358479 RepID=UPI000F675068|nr:hypothetical protein [Tenacibaculum singaporense]RSC96067.1 hypothetical protein EI424_02800 [Tenacibaculum singaporense]
MKKLLVLFLFVGLVCNTYALNNVNSNSVNDTEQTVFTENTQKVTTAVADFNCDIQNVAVYLSMDKITFEGIDHPTGKEVNNKLFFYDEITSLEEGALENLRNTNRSFEEGVNFDFKEFQHEMMNALNNFTPSLDDLIITTLIKKGYEAELNAGLETFAKSDRCLIVINHQTRPYEYTLYVDDKSICQWIYPDPSIKKEGDKFSATYLEFTEL